MEGLEDTCPGFWVWKEEGALKETWGPLPLKGSFLALGQNQEKNLHGLATHSFLIALGVPEPSLEPCGQSVMSQWLRGKGISGETEFP